MLPFEPEPVVKLKARFSKALKEIWVVPADFRMDDRPGLHRENVFDFNCGIRLLISYDKLLSDTKKSLHISASWEHGEPKSWYETTKSVKDHFDSIRDKDYGKFMLLGMSTAGIPHWIVE